MKCSCVTQVRGSHVSKDSLSPLPISTSSQRIMITVRNSMRSLLPLRKYIKENEALRGDYFPGSITCCPILYSIVRYHIILYDIVQYYTILRILFNIIQYLCATGVLDNQERPFRDKRQAGYDKAPNLKPQ
ncbi:hypothetical protein AVEN_223207-1 [Araneus ventricosus]|uniref:Uncharacterized protein n=1 Tax=Araneus ventricosus TaxID=182803 RepID=A0A4Y2DPL9_ARAVE|nr:hypothetical protein AVEN_230308-1 [Araneus ventricosus]GBM18014.1 hypothetical protein AVEN_240504-1 [Araneus ventricosus]GBM18034.1 hypothetical protein AVEN_266723-1 [Araneus ventricosus]GBM18129.1 hypothetical protein AVEN_223207-1 [Araneus ventricosus]